MQFRNLPSVNNVLATPHLADVTNTYSHEWVVGLVRLELSQARRKIRDGGSAPGLTDVAERVCQRIKDAVCSEPRQVINATGVVIHTNLGRAPLSKAAIQAAGDAASGYSNLEFDLESGTRGSRQAQSQNLLKQLTGAEAALVVNNNASAVLLGLSALAAGKRVVVSRAEAVEIGGGFRVPDVMLQSGGILVDVGTTNRTYISDYEEAATDDTAAFLKVHTSNFKVEGFTSEVTAGELAEAGNRLGIAVLHDVGSGTLLATENYGMAHEPTPQESIRAGMDLVFFSGDKLLGGPQSGIVVGKKGLIDRLSRHPLARAVRIDKLSLASLAATLVHYVRDEAEQEIPVWRMISMSKEILKKRAQSWKRTLGRNYEVEEGRSAVGGGSLPGETLPTWMLAVDCQVVDGGAQEVMRRLRNCRPPVVARIEADRVLLDPRTVSPEEDSNLLMALRASVG